jgi:hypothetical protein
MGRRENSDLWVRDKYGFRISNDDLKSKGKKSFQ